MIPAGLPQRLHVGLDQVRRGFRTDLPVKPGDRKLRKDTKLCTGKSGLLHRPQHRLCVGKSGPFHAELSNGDS
jgi:hypothetical protein